MALIFRLIILFYFILFPSLGLALSYGAKLCKSDDRFVCYVVKRGDSWDRLFPDPEEQDFIMRLNRMNTSLYKGMTIAIPRNEFEMNLSTISPFPLQISAPGSKLIVVSLKKLAWGAYDEGGQLVSWGPASGGRGWCSDIGSSCNTVTGKFTIYRKAGPECYSTKFPVDEGGAPMPYCMFFNGGFALHGSYDVPGYNASHGCVRLFVEDAQWLNEEFVMDDRVSVIVNN